MYIEDEQLFDCFLLQIVCCLAYYSNILLLNKQQNRSKLGTRPFDKMLVYALMFMVLAVFFSEQASLKQYSFIPLPNWHKLINVLLLVEQCSLVLYLGRVSGTLSRDLGEAMFGLNLILVLVLQEKDSVHGMVGINYSLIPLIINNGYMFYSNCRQLASRDNIEPPSFIKD